MKQLRETRGLSVRQAARLVPMSSSHWSELELGKSRPIPEMALLIDRVLRAGGKLAALAPVGDATPVEVDPLASAGADPRPLDAGDVERMHATVRNLIELDRLYGAGELAATGLRAAREAWARLAAGQYRGALGADLRRASAELTQVAGWLAYDADLQTRARQLWQEARTGAELCGDQPFEMFVRDQMAMQALHVGRPDEALVIADLALAHPAVSGRTAAIFHLRRGRALADLGDDTSALSELAHARADLSDGVRAGDSPWTWWMHGAELDLHASLLTSALGRHTQAVELAQRAVEDIPAEQVRCRQVYQAYRVQVLVAAGADDDTVAVLDEMRAGLAAVDSVRTRNLLLAAATRPGVSPHVAAAAAETLAAASGS